MISQTLGRYRIQAEIARGAMGKVYRGYDPLCRRVVAIKTIRPEYLDQRNARDYLQRFQREARTAGALSHPNIVTVYDVSDDYFVMEYLEGVTLLSLLAQRGGLNLTDVLKIVAPIADALDHAHQQGIIHRDIKPSNIMILSDGQPKIMDFGVAHLESTIMTTGGESFGSPPYMSPEQILGEEPTAQADIFSLGVVTYELLTGQRPFVGNKIPSILFRVINQEPASPRKWKEDLPPRYDKVFSTVLAKETGQSIRDRGRLRSRDAVEQAGKDRALDAHPRAEARARSRSSTAGRTDRTDRTDWTDWTDWKRDDQSARREGSPRGDFAFREEHHGSDGS